MNDSFAFSQNEMLDLAYGYVSMTDVNVFLTGKAGTGKTTFLKRLRECSPKRMVVTAPTGVAAINAGGVTIHSFFQLPFGPQLIEKSREEGGAGQTTPDMNKFSREKINIIRSLDLLVIDEISMVRTDLLDGVDRVLRRYKNKYKPFGGVQLLMIGDLQQLAPVVKDDEWSLLKEVYDSPFFFSSKALAQTRFVTIELTHIYRQQDSRFVELLNQIRSNQLDASGCALLNACYKPDFEPEPEEGYITLTTHNQQAARINAVKMDALPAHPVLFQAEVSGVFPEYSYPTDLKLQLKTGAQVMFARNDASREKRFYNGKMGIITSIEEGVVTVQCQDGDEVKTEAVEWHNYTYTIDPETEEIRENLIGTFKQIPLKLAWAITIHKSQGLTFDKAVIDANAAFAHGQVYVALSRCRTLEGMILRSPVDIRRLRTDTNIRMFMQNAGSNPPDQNSLQESRHRYERSLLQELFDFKSLRYRSDQLLKLIREHEGILQGAPAQPCLEYTNAIRTHLQEVSLSFSRQTDRLLNENPDAGGNALLQERVKKAAAYFSEKMQTISATFLRAFNPESDNKAVRKSIREHQDKLEDEIRFKLQCLESVRNGFDMLNYLEAKSRAGIEKVPVVSAAAESGPPSEAASGTPHPELYLLLKEWRRNCAAASGKSEYLILPQQALLQVSIQLPLNLLQLKRIKGIGEKKAVQFGKQVLGIVADYCETQGILARLL